MATVKRLTAAELKERAVELEQQLAVWAKENGIEYFYNPPGGRGWFIGHGRASLYFRKEEDAERMQSKWFDFSHDERLAIRAVAPAVVKMKRESRLRKKAKRLGLVAIKGRAVMQAAKKWDFLCQPIRGLWNFDEHPLGVGLEFRWMTLEEAEQWLDNYAATATRSQTASARQP
jgi:hypothetical protein